MSIRVHGTCHKRACDGWQPAQGSPLSQVFLRNLHRRQARSFRISLACLRCSGSRGPRRLPTLFSPSFLPLEVLRMTGLVDLEIGLLRGPEFLRATVVDGGDVAPEPLEGLARLDRGAEDDLMGMGPTAEAGLTVSSPWWWFSVGKQLRWLDTSTYVSESGEKGGKKGASSKLVPYSNELPPSEELSGLG
jgi:hypothetical protein